MKFYLLFIICFVCHASWSSDWMPLESIRKESLPIVQIKEDLLFVKVSPRLQFNQEVIVVRIYKDNLEVVAQGAIQGQQDQFWLISLNRSASNSLPTLKDRVLPIEKISPKSSGEELIKSNSEFASSSLSYKEPGYIELGMQRMDGDHRIQTDIEANQFKRFPFQFSQNHFLWYFDFLWRFGFFYSTQNSTIPVVGYDQLDKPTSLTEERFELRFRLAPWVNNFKTHLKVISYNHSFVTTNEDEYILSTQYTGSGLGVYNYYEFSPSLWRGKERINVNFHRLYLDYNYIPLSSKDGLVSRGTGAGVLSELELGMQLLLSTKLVPWFNRFFIDIAVFQNSAQLNFTGETQSSADGFYLIPPSGQSIELNQGYRVRFGWRFDDYIGQLFKTR
jgi:hypothetical protein